MKEQSIQTNLKVLNKIMQSALGHSGKSFLRINKGQSNEVYLVETKEKSFILRLAKETDYDIFAVEQWAMQEVRSRGVPTAKILAQGSVEYNEEMHSYQLQEKLPGESMDDLLEQSKIGKAEAIKLAEQLGEILATIHSISIGTWGRITSPACGVYNSFEMWLLTLQKGEEKFDRALAKFKTFGVPSFSEVYSSLIYLQSFVTTTPVLLHYDLTPDHVFVDHEKISGVIDWGAVHSGDPVRDFVRWNYWNTSSSPINLLNSPYSKSLISTEGFKERLRLTSIIDALLLLYSSTYKTQNDEDAKIDALAIKNLLR